MGTRGPGWDFHPQVATEGWDGLGILGAAGQSGEQGLSQDLALPVSMWLWVSFLVHSSAFSPVKGGNHMTYLTESEGYRENLGKRGKASVNGS